jgi:hypothetical protein
LPENAGRGTDIPETTLWKGVRRGEGPKAFFKIGNVERKKQPACGKDLKFEPFFNVDL